jgi:ABC-type antimicrobial peptide transport system permease subunit
MFKNYLKTSWRNLIKNKAHSIINIVGLSVGMAVAMLIGLWIWNELSFDKYHENYDRIAQVMQQRTDNGVINTGVAVPQPLATALKKNYGSDFKYIVMSSWTESHLLTVGDKKISYTGNFMEPAAPAMFTLKMLKGTRNGLNDPSSILISSSVANALFDNDDPIGKTIQLDNAASLKVSGVYEDLPENTSLHDLAFIAPWDYYVVSRDWVKNSRDNWGENSFQLYVQLSANADMKKVSSKIKNIKLKNVDADDAKYKPVILLQPMRRWHLYSEFKNGVNTGGAVEYVWMFGIIGIFVLLLACINFMNLSTARSEKRAKEVGIRKALGSLRTQLMNQFFCESLLLAAIAFCVATVLVQLALPFFNELCEKNMSIPLTNFFFWMTCIVFTIFTGTVAGIYPALYLSSFKPVKVLKGTFKAGRLASVPRKLLVTVQFAVSVVLIIGTIVVFKQIQFAKNRPVGYNRNGLISLELNTGDLEKHFKAFESDLYASEAISGIAGASSPMTGIHNSRGDISWKETDPNLTYDFANIRVTSDYGKTTGWHVLSGRDFSSQLLTDSSAVILNEAAVKYMELANPLGEIVRFNNKNYTIIGVIKDMVMESPYQPSKQTIFYLSQGDFDDILLRINPSLSTHEALSRIAAICKKYSPSVPFDYKFVDEDYARKFDTEERIGKLAGVFALFAILISCLGLTGMASFMTEQRTKEIGVRKVLGASVLNLWELLSKEFVIIFLISLCIAIPVAYYFMHNWLQNYEYRTNLSWWIFVVTGLAALIIVLITVSFQAIKAAIANPVKSLRSE